MGWERTKAMWTVPKYLAPHSRQFVFFASTVANDSSLGIGRMFLQAKNGPSRASWASTRVHWV